MNNINNWRKDGDWRGVMSGYRDGAGLIGQGLRGNYWSSTANSTSGAYGLNFTSDSVVNGAKVNGIVNTAEEFNKSHGIAVRCVL
jgi:hypothetical protein